ncbi:ABC transporter permease [Nocardioides daejeonensis]|uniref:ABC transporter permease n=1 Tax=Nocardioides daejeonensis TaxID=1046556 RepID=UPI000D7405C8|nr:ABC transporter permease [Nocardioides daejeonensis]
MSATSTQAVRGTARRIKANVLRLAALIALFAVWGYAQGPGGASTLIVPKIGDVFDEFLQFLENRAVYDALWVTLTELVISLVIAALSAFVVAFWAARTDLRAKVIEPLLVWGYLVPHILFYPLIILWLGVGMSSKIAYATSSAFFPIAFNCLRAFRGVDPKYVSVGRAYGASKRQMDWQIKFRAAVPMAAAGLRIGCALTLVTVLVAEMLSATNGLGYLLKFYSQSFNTARSYAIILVILLVVGIFHLLISKLLPKNMEGQA